MEALASEMRAETSFSTIAKLETGRMGLTLDYMIEISSVLGVKPTDLISDPGKTYTEYPLIGAVAAGQWREAIQVAEEFIALPNGTGGPNSFALTVEGDSMDKIVGNGGFVLVDPDSRDLSPGLVYIISNGDNETTFKKYVAPPPRLEPCSNNPKHVAIPIGREPFIVIGRVVFAGSRL